MKAFSSNENLGALKALLSPHVFSEELNREIDRYPKQTVIGLGQGGGRIAAEMARFGYPTYLLNSSKSDMDEHHYLIPDKNRILTTSDGYPELEGTDKNAQLGYDIAVENKDKYKEIAIKPEVQNAEFVWVAVSLGGGTGNGALKVALTYLSKVRVAKALPGNKIPLGVICSLPSSDERGSSFRRNALAGIALLQKFIDDNKLGSVIVIDNEKIKDYYANEPLKTYGGTEIDAKSYSNMVVATLLAEISTLPLLNGRSVFDKTELLTTLSTAGWLTISKNKNLDVNDANFETVIEKLFSANEVLANYDFDRAFAGAVAVLYPDSKNVSPKVADDVYRYASNLLDTKVNLSIAKNSRMNKLSVYGLAVVASPSIRIKELKHEKDYWEKVEKEQEEARKQASFSLGLDEFDNFFTSSSDKRGKQSLSLDDLDDDFDVKNEPAAMVSLDDLDDEF